LWVCRFWHLSIASRFRSELITPVPKPWKPRQASKGKAAEVVFEHIDSSLRL
jgi:hypothetical protein